MDSEDFCALFALALICGFSAVALLALAGF